MCGGPQLPLQQQQKKNTADKENLSNKKVLLTYEKGLLS